MPALPPPLWVSATAFLRAMDPPPVRVVGGEGEGRGLGEQKKTQTEGGGPQAGMGRCPDTRGHKKWVRNASMWSQDLWDLENIRPAWKWVSPCFLIVHHECERKKRRARAMIFLRILQHQREGGCPLGVLSRRGIWVGGVNFAWGGPTSPGGGDDGDSEY